LKSKMEPIVPRPRILPKTARSLRIPWTGLLLLCLMAGGCGGGGDGSGTTDTDPPKFTLTVNTIGEGDVSVTPGGGIYPVGTQVFLTAAPKPGSQFLGFSGDITTTFAAYTLTITRNTRITATFTRSDAPTDPDTLQGTWRLRLRPGGGGEELVVRLHVEVIDDAVMFKADAADLAGSGMGAVAGGRVRLECYLVYYSYYLLAFNLEGTATDRSISGTWADPQGQGGSFQMEKIDDRIDTSLQWRKIAYLDGGPNGMIDQVTLPTFRTDGRLVREQMMPHKPDDELRPMTVYYDYDADGSLPVKKQTDLDTNGIIDIVTYYHYNFNDLLTGMEIDYGYDGNFEERVFYSAHNTRGDPIKREEYWQSTGSSDFTCTMEYTYDRFNRHLTHQETCGNGATLKIVYVRDPAGQIFTMREEFGGVRNLKRITYYLWELAR
jgi:hypothetical protein